MLAVNPVLECVNAPVVVPPWATQFVTGAGVVPQQVPRAEMEAGTPRDVTLAPRVALVDMTEVTVGVVTVGTIKVANVPSGEYPVPVEFVA